MNAQPREEVLVRESLVVLTQDQTLVSAIRAVATEHELSTVGDEADLAAHLLNDHAGVAVLDAAAVLTPIARLTERLKTQFPDLVLVVAGGPGDQAAVLAQVTNGTVYRFLHKPVSEQRVKLFVNAAWRRHGQEHAASVAPAATVVATPWAAPRLPRGAFTAGAVMLILAAALLAWLELRQPRSGASARAAVGADIRPEAVPDKVLEGLLARAETALAQDHLLAPAGQSAVQLYTQARARSATDPRIAAGFDRVTDRLLLEAEQALLDQRTDTAAQLTDAARAIHPDNVRVAFLTTQIDKERERTLLAQARQSAAAGDVRGAITALDNAARDGRRTTLVAEAREEFAQQQVDERVHDYLQRAEQRSKRGALIEPPRDNARFLIESARTLEPANPEVRLAARQLADRITAQARSALAAANLDEAQKWIAAAEDVGVPREDIASLNRDAQRLRATSKADAAARLSQLFNQRLAQAKLIEPASDSASYYLGQLTATDGANPSTQLARQAFTARLLDAARVAAAQNDSAAAHRWLAAASQAGADAASVAGVERTLTSLDTANALREIEPVNAGALQRLRYIEPEFPARAEDRKTSGWVDLTFMVRADGSVDNVTVTGAEPAGIFEDSAVTAVRKWRYRPVERDGRAIEQLARIRIRFAAQ